FHDLAPHQLDLMYYFFGPVKKVNGIATNQGGQYAADDMVAGTILFENGVGFSGSWSFGAGENNDQCEIIGSKGKISFSVFSGHTITIDTDNTITTIDFDPLQHVQQPMIEATVQFFLGHQPNPCSGDEGAEVMRLIESMVSGNLTNS
ncbi:MAG: Gfo/Idh/MocA family oxidoreductase, partial [Bacteroidota bacterium]